ncbi:glycosyltransferase 61 family protein [Paracoccus spongiarum]|uniref:Glycosyltransferase family 61 protein n=1 Tax=Paracoccus spongiarum TaxID=3064387 RepID=A0ABT9JG03_9RHOB|nr:glycosyltransferase family 61 protein [Paracoccus sp. 2205BS29-5]MDP5308757.1 glycosyltransferase family 61 protein [Paracoccus sp. 2205BS29-5]
MIGRPPPEFFDKAERWQIAPAETLYYPPALALPGQVDRIRAAVFASLPDTIEALTRQGDSHEGPTTGFRLRAVDLVDGVLYHGGGEHHLRNRQRRFGLTPRPAREVSGALYETWTTNRWFGSWLMEACVAHDLAAAHGDPVTTAAPPSQGGHQDRYEALAGMAPRRIDGDAHFTELVMFDDYASNSHKAARADALRRRLLQGRSPQAVPGVFLLRGHAGDPRLLVNERDLAEDLARHRGFVVIDPLDATVDQLIDACGAARAIVGVEGSQLVHGITVAPPGAAIIPIQPPERVAATLKHQSDRLGQRFGLLVAEGSDSRFRLERDDLMATLDLFE